MTKLDSKLKKHHFAEKGLCSQSSVFFFFFPSGLYTCKIWSIKKAECLRVDPFELWCWRTFLRDPLTARISYQSTLKEIKSEYSLEVLMLKLKLQNFGHLMGTGDSSEKKKKKKP